MNTGASANVCAGLSNGRVVMWEYLPQKWNGAEAAALYRGAIIKTLRKERGQKRHYNLIEDNDPSGYKSSKARAAKSELGICAVPMPTFSPGTRSTSASGPALSTSCWRTAPRTSRLWRRTKRGSGARRCACRARR